MTHYVYKTIFDDGCYYIGVRKLPVGFTPLSDPYRGSGRAVRAKLRTHQSKKQVLFEGLSKEEAYWIERQLVTYETLKDPLCLNLVLGGRGGYLETVTLRKRWQRDREKLKKAIEKTASCRRGKTKHTDKALAAMAEKLSGRSKESHEHIRRASEKLSGRTKETHEYLSRAAEIISGKLKGRRKPINSLRMSGHGNPSYRLNTRTAQQLQRVTQVPDHLYMRRHARELQDKVIELAKKAVLRAEISRQTGIPESTVNAFISKVLKICVA